MGQVCGTEAVPIVEGDSEVDFEEYFPDIQLRGEERAAKLAKAKALKRSREEAGNLRSTFKERLIREIINPCCPDGECLTLVLDAHSAKIVGSVAKTSDLLFPEGNIAIVTNLARKREPSPLMEAIYFISPTLDNVKRVISDFPEDSNERNMYYGVHIFFTSHAPTSIGAWRTSRTSCPSSCCSSSCCASARRRASPSRHRRCCCSFSSRATSTCSSTSCHCTTPS